MSLSQQIKEAKEQLKALESQVPTAKIGKLTVKIGDKGSVNIYGLNKQYPVCLYLNQLSQITEMAKSPEFMKFLQDNMNKLSVKEEKKAE